jgi:hypothetical protein
MAQTNKSKAAQAQKTAQKPITTPEQTTLPKQKSSPKAANLKQPVDQAKYDKYTSLKFLELSGAKLREEVKKEMDAMEAELKQCSGVKPIKTMTAAIQHEVIRLVEGVPLPENYANIIQGSSNPAHYLG